MKQLIAILLAVVFTVGLTGTASAQDAATQAKIDALQAQLDAVKAQLDALKAAQLAKPAPAASPQGRPVTVTGNNVTLMIGNEPVQIYGNLDLSFDDTTKGLQKFYPQGGSPVGNVGYLAAVSTNLSYIGVRGVHKLGPLSGLVYQLETQIDVSSTSGTVNSNNNSDSVVKGGLTSRNSYIGIQNKAGSFKIGKTDAPYKNSTARMNPFSGELGDYSVIMGNSGGDNRVEFGTRFDHALWYESPQMGKVTFSFLAAPGQNRSYDDGNISAGESDCAGGNSPGSGALPPECNDGAFGAAWSTALVYDNGPVYLTGAYELHKNVNRTSDLADLNPADTVDEQAWKVGGQFRISRATTLDAIYENLTRFDPPFLQYQNERTRNGFWLAMTQRLTMRSDINFGWARANPTPGDPGQHNTPGGANPDNMANMYTIAYKHMIDRHLSWYTDWAMTLNHPAAHFDLGAGGRGVTTDCHDATPLSAFDATNPTLLSYTGPHCFAGGHLEGFSAGLKVTF
ncbi:MAG TPA: porin [Candidatus Elarobacter sp.]|jgi:predicted porin|nr:porin [Candidatus Elarobacter sp.]